MPAIILGIGSAVASGVGSIMGGAAQSAAIERQNQQAYRNWIQANTQKTFNNSREQFQAAYQTLQQLRRNASIGKAAWETEYDAKQAVDFRSGYQQKQLANQLQTQKASLLNAILTKGISSSSGMYASMATAQALDYIQNASLIKYNSDMEKRNIDQQTKGMLSQQTQNIFIPNIDLYDQEPIYGDASAAATGGLVSGLVQIGGALGATFAMQPGIDPNFVGPPSPKG